MAMDHQVRDWEAGAADKREDLELVGKSECRKIFF